MVLPASPTDLSVASRETSQSHPGHVEQPDLPIVVRQSDDLLVRRHADPGPADSAEFSQNQRQDKHHQLKNCQPSRGQIMF